MKRIVSYFFAASFLLFVSSSQLWANEKESNVSSAETTVAATIEVNKMIDRLNEIKEMDFKEMNSLERKELRKEVRSIRNDLKAVVKSDSEADAKSAADAAAQARDGFYISTGAAIIIVLLLILLL